MTPITEATGEILYQEKFSNGLEQWHHEGAGEITQPESGIMQLNCIGSAQGGAGCHAFCRQDFPDDIALSFDLRILTSNGLLITFLALQGLNGEDAIEGLPPREGYFREYVRVDARLKSYHVSVSRYNDRGEHTGVSNFRRNPGLFLVGQGPDLCKEIGRQYRITIIKSGRNGQLGVNGEVAHQFTDWQNGSAPIPAEGKIGFRAIGSEVIAQISNLTVTALR